MPMSQGAKRARPKQPENLNQLYGSYTGSYAKQYQPSYDGSLRRSTAAGTTFKSHTTREDNNQQGRDAHFEEVTPAVHSPIKFALQRARKIDHPRDGCMVANAHENRFVAFNDIPTINTKYKMYQSPGFHNWAEHGLQDFIKKSCCTTEENVHHQTYHPDHKLVEKDLSVGVPCFERYISKEQRKEVCPFGETADVYDYVAVKSGHHRTHSHHAGVAPFKLLMGRDNLYQRMHGLPK